MSLDKNLFTLIFTPHKDNANVIDLVDPSGTTHYRKQRTPAPNGEYRIEVYDPMSESLLATAAGTNASAKVKTIELCNPTSVVELKYTGTLSFKWGFKWEGHDFEWKREECFMIRKPDPPVIIAVTKEPKGRLQTTTVQILDYNLNRFDIDDRKGLEIVVLTALLTFQDANEAYHTPDTPTATGSANPLSRASSAKAGPVVLAPPATMADSSSSGYGGRYGGNDAGGPPPLPPPKPAPKTGVDRIAELQAIKGEYNEIVISDEGSIQDYASYCNNLLQDDAMLFITVKSAEMEQVPKVLQVVEETKRIRYKAGLDEEELHQYVLYDVQEARKGPRIINLDDEKKNKYAPPKNLTVHLSKISMPELQPKAGGSHRDSKIGPSSSKDKKAAAAASSSKVPSRPAPELPPPSNTKNNNNKPSKHKPPKEPKPKTPSPPPMHGQKPGKGGNKLQRPSGPSGQSGQKVHAHQVHPHQPSPSPSQLNNPGIYAAPPPQKHSRPTSAYEPRPSSSGGGGVSFPMPWGGSGGGGGGGGNNGSGSGSGMTPAQLYASSFGRRYDSPSSGAQGHTHSSSYPTSWNPSSGPPPPPPPAPPQQQQPTIHQPQPQQAHASMGQFGVKPITTANVVQGVSSVAHGLMGMINNARHK